MITGKLFRRKIFDSSRHISIETIIVFWAWLYRPSPCKERGVSSTRALPVTYLRTYPQGVFHRAYRDLPLGHGLYSSFLILSRSLYGLLFYQFAYHWRCLFLRLPDLLHYNTEGHYSGTSETSISSDKQIT